MNEPDATERFSSRVDNYARYRPDYPSAALDHLESRCGLRPGCTVADIGSGTGLLTAQLLKRGLKVFAVEPNRDMRAAGERVLSLFAGFTSVAGSAEATGLPPHAVDGVVAAQSFHWFDHPRARAEFLRILRPGGPVVLLWNYRKLEATPFLAGYEALLRRHCPDYAEILDRERHRRQVEEFFGGRVDLWLFDHVQHYDWAGLEGRHLSQSYVFLEGPQFAPMMRELRALFDAHQREGSISFEYETRLYAGSLTQTSDTRRHEGTK